MLQLTKEKMLIEVKKRTENHGDDRVNAYDVYLSGDFANAAILPKLAPGLLDAFYMSNDQQDIDADYKPELRHPLMGPITWGLEQGRMALDVHDVDSVLDDLRLRGKDIDKVKLSMKQGGT